MYGYSNEYAHSINRIEDTINKFKKPAKDDIEISAQSSKQSYQNFIHDMEISPNSNMRKPVPQTFWQKLFSFGCNNP